MKRRSITPLLPALWILVAALLLLLLGACGDSGSTPPSDGGGGETASRDGTSNDGTGSDGAGGGDLGPAGNAGCNAILDCIDKNCDITASDYTVCVSGCRISGTHAAQKKFDDYRTCADGAIAGSCAADCGGSDANACAKCIRSACITQVLDCTSDV
ncbi:MAG: hypothetical protein KC503_20920 [Myxococcales bacterium]|nr:hypothetical protein [Myxococcales bacterium]